MYNSGSNEQRHAACLNTFLGMDVAAPNWAEQAFSRRSDTQRCSLSEKFIGLGVVTPYLAQQAQSCYPDTQTAQQAMRPGDLLPAQA